jgi:hypothetical protein
MTLDEQILHLWRTGLDTSEISHRVGVDVPRVCRAIQRNQDDRYASKRGRTA